MKRIIRTLLFALVVGMAHLLMTGAIYAAQVPVHAIQKNEHKPLMTPEEITELLSQTDFDFEDVTLRDGSEAELQTARSKDGRLLAYAFLRPDDDSPMNWVKQSEKTIKLKDKTKVLRIEIKRTNGFGRAFLFLRLPTNGKTAEPNKTWDEIAVPVM